mgnify:CR=1 FL=1
MKNGKKIRDIVYGFIELDEQEIEIINHPAFQRLRRIRQLALTDPVSVSNDLRLIFRSG